MEKVILNYRVIVKSDRRVNTNEKCYTAFCPTLDIVDDGVTLDEALANIQEGIQCYIEALVKEGKKIPPPDNTEEGVVTGVKISLTEQPHFLPL